MTYDLVGDVRKVAKVGKQILRDGIVRAVPVVQYNSTMQNAKKKGKVNGT